MNDQTLLITGGAGFIGSDFIAWYLTRYPGAVVVNLDKLTYAGDPANLADVRDNPDHIFIQGDVADRELVESLFDRYDIRGVIHFAAESHVDNSIAGPEVFVRTNVNGAFTLLDVARRHERSNNELVAALCRCLDRLQPRPDGTSYRNQITYVPDRPGHDRRYASDPTRIETELGWRAMENLDGGLEKTVKWYLAKYLVRDVPAA